MRRTLCFVFLLALLQSPAVLAALTPAALSTAGVNLPAGATLPPDILVAEVSGQKHRIGEELAGGPAFVVFADYTCKNLCGPALVLLGSALVQSGLSPSQYRLIVIGIDPRDTAADAERMAAAQLPETLRGNTVLLMPDGRSLAALTSALGFHFVYDGSIDQFAHPEIVYALAADGHVLRLLSPLTLNAADVTTAFTPPTDLPQTLSGRFRVLCYHLGLLTGVHNAAIQLLLRLAAGLTLAAMAAAFFLMLKWTRPA
jgi:protein SCO1